MIRLQEKLRDVYLNAKLVKMELLVLPAMMTLHKILYLAVIAKLDIIL